MIPILTLVLLVAVFIGVGIATGNASSNDGFYRMNRQGTERDYKQNTVAFTLQTAVTVYFIYWGFSYGWANLYFILTWMLGLFAFSRLIHRIIPFLATKTTFIEVIAQNSKGLRIFAAFLNLAVIIGLIYSELFFASTFYGAAAAGTQTGGRYALLFWASFAFLVCAALIYVSQGGARKVVLTDYYQLAVAYIGYGLLFAWFIPAMVSRSLTEALIISALGVLVLTSIAVVGKTPSRPSERIWLSPEVCASLSAVLIAIVFGIAWINSRNAAPLGAVGIPGVTAMVRAPGGWVPLISFGLANLLWQFSDYTAYQRLTILPRDPNSSLFAQRLRRAINTTIFTSPLTWTLGITLGMALRATDWIPQTSEDVFGALVGILIGPQQSLGTLMAQGALSIFIAGVLLSTVDSSFLAGVQILEEDIYKTHLTMRKRIAWLLFIGLLVIAFSIFHLWLQVDILAKLSFIYSMGLVFAGPMLLYMQGIRPPVWFVSVGLALSVIAGYVALSIPPALPMLVIIVLPQLAAIVLSLLWFLLLGWLIPWKPKPVA